MNIYLAAPYRRRVELSGYAAELEAMGRHVTSRWLSASHDHLVDTVDDPATRGVWAAEDLQDIEDADTLIAFTVPVEQYRRGGMHVEVGFALAMGKRVIEVGGHRPNVFYCLPWVEVYSNWEQCKEALELPAAHDGFVLGEDVTELARAKK